jgi:hypothetical protein
MSVGVSMKTALENGYLSAAFNHSIELIFN